MVYLPLQLCHSFLVLAQITVKSIPSSFWAVNTVAKIVLYVETKACHSIGYIYSVLPNV